MIQFEEFQYLVEYAIDFFKRGSEKNNKYIYEDVAWDYARGVLGNILDENEKKDLYSRVIEKLNNDNGRYKKYQIHFPYIIYESVSNIESGINILNEKSEAILLFLMDWNYKRFLNQINLNRLKEYIRKTLQGINTILPKINNISSKSSKEAFREIRDNISVNTNISTGKKELEHVSTAKILMLINPDKFIALDKQIIERFGFSSDDRENYHENYGMFNELIDNFINRNCIDIRNIENYAKYYMRRNSYTDIDSHNIRKLLDMIFWITCNKICIDNSNFYIYAERLIDDILHLFWIKESEQFKNSNSQEKTFWETFCNHININSNEAVQWLEGGFSPGEAKKWMDKNFSLEQAKEWRNNGVRSSEGAQYWENQGYSPSNAKEKINQIIYQIFCSNRSREEKELARWISIGFFPGEIVEWEEKRFSPEEAAAWQTSGFSLDQAIVLKSKHGCLLQTLNVLGANDQITWDILEKFNNSF